MLDFTAIDFETANKYANSACSLAAVTMNDDRCVKEGYTLIQPPFMRFDPGNIQIHGITPDQVVHKPKFDALWVRICRIINWTRSPVTWAIPSTTIRLWTMPGPVPTSSSKRLKSLVLRLWKNSSTRHTSS